MQYQHAITFYEQCAILKGATAMFMTSNGVSEQIHGYRIVNYIDLKPNVLEYVGTIDAKGVESWDAAYDQLFDKVLAQ